MKKLFSCLGIASSVSLIVLSLLFPVNSCLAWIHTGNAVFVADGNPLPPFPPPPPPPTKAMFDGNPLPPFPPPPPPPQKFDGTTFDGNPLPPFPPPPPPPQKLEAATIPLVA